MGTRVGKRLGKRLGGALWLDLCEPSLPSMPGAQLVTDADYAHNVGAGASDYIFDEVTGTNVAVASATTSQRPTIVTTDIAGHNTLQIPAGKSGYYIDSATLAGKFDGGVDLTMLVRARLGTLGSIIEMMAISALAGGGPARGDTSYILLASTFSTASGSWALQKSGGTIDTAQINHARDITTFHTYGLTALGGTWYLYIDGALAGTAARGAHVPSGMNRVTLGVSSTPTCSWKLWGLYSAAWSASDHAISHRLCLEREG